VEGDKLRQVVLFVKFTEADICRQLLVVLSDWRANVLHRGGRRLRRLYNGATVLNAATHLIDHEVTNRFCERRKWVGVFTIGNNWFHLPLDGAIGADESFGDGAPFVVKMFDDAFSPASATKCSSKPHVTLSAPHLVVQAVKCRSSHHF